MTAPLFVPQKLIHRQPCFLAVAPMRCKRAATRHSNSDIPLTNSCPAVHLRDTTFPPVQCQHSGSNYRICLDILSLKTWLFLANPARLRKEIWVFVRRSRLAIHCRRVSLRRIRARNLRPAPSLNLENIGKRQIKGLSAKLAPPMVKVMTFPLACRLPHPHHHTRERIAI